MHRTVNPANLELANTSFPQPLAGSFGYDEPKIPKRWYPKVTPFRFLTLLFGISPGVLKAVFTYKGSQIAPVAVEWLCGTVFFLVFYFLDTLETDLRLRDDSYQWFYDYDCLDIVWRFLKLFSINAPEYSNSEAPFRNPYRTQPMITNYRLLVSATVLFFGMLKAVLAYLGYSDGATAVDWLLGVIITTGLYILGLYESNTAKLLPVLFSRNDSRLVLFMTYEGCLIFFSIALSYMCFLGVNFAKDYLDIALHGQAPAPPDQTTLDGLAILGGGILLIDTLVIAGYLSLLPLFLAILILLRYFEPSAAMPRLLISFMQKHGILDRVTPRHTIPTQDILDFSVFLLRFMNHFIMHTFVLVAVGGITLLTTSVATNLFSRSILFGLYLMTFGVLAAAMVIPVVISMMRPFHRVWKTGVWRGQHRSLGFLF